jgi:hypothetical protein
MMLGGMLGRATVAVIRSSVACEYCADHQVSNINLLNMLPRGCLSACA